VVHAAVAPPCVAALQALLAMYSGIVLVQEGSRPSLHPALNNHVLRALAACKVERPTPCRFVFLLTFLQALPTSSAAIATAALLKRESLARDVLRELNECQCSASHATASADHQDANVATTQEGYGWIMSEDGEDGTGLEDDLFAFTGGDCDVCLVPACGT
jgi:hypothetical protein